MSQALCVPVQQVEILVAWAAVRPTPSSPHRPGPISQPIESKRSGHNSRCVPFRALTIHLVPELPARAQFTTFNALSG